MKHEEVEEVSASTSSADGDGGNITSDVMPQLH